MIKILMPSLNSLVDKDYLFLKNEETESLIKSMLKSLHPVPNPTILQISGIPGSGKSTYCKTHQIDNFLYLSFDKIMVSLKSYQETLKLYGSVEAFNRYEMVARVIGYELLNRAISMRLNIMFEHSGTNNAHIELFKNITKLGYKTAVNFIMCNKELAIKRAEDRAKETKRYVPRSLIEERANKFNFYIKEYQKITSEINILDGANNFSSLKKI